METEWRTHSDDDSVRQGQRLLVSELDYVLPDELIAQEPPERRDDARLLVVDRKRRALSDRTIRDLPELLGPGDLLVLNNTRVLPARFQCRRATGGLVRGLFLEECGPGTWGVMLQGARRLRETERLVFLDHDGRDGHTSVNLIERLEGGHWIIRVDSEEPAPGVLDRVGRTPLPPYIKRSESARSSSDQSDRERYQTVYAKVPGAVAAPTAGLHLTDSLLSTVRDRGVGLAFVTLHVGPGTFKPIATRDLSDHVMHKEWFELSDPSAEAINDCRKRGGRIVSVGTTSLRVLESAAGLCETRSSEPTGPLVEPCSGWTDLFIRPPYRFRAVDALLTNFHLPRTTLLALVMAFAGKDLTREAYAHAIQESYRFYSFGDAMFIA